MPSCLGGPFGRGPARSGLRLLFIILLCASVGAADAAREITWDGIAPALQPLLARHGFAAENFTSRIKELRQRNLQRVGEGDRDHLIYYALQSRAFTALPPIEPARSAQEFLAAGTVGSEAAARLEAFAAAASTRREYGTRMAIFRQMLAREKLDLRVEYARAMTFAAPSGAQYQERGLSTDTAVDVGYAVYLALGALRSLDPQRRVRRVLIVGPGMDLAPRTGFVESEPPQSYQPYAVIDALLATGLSDRNVLSITAADINPRVIDWLNRTKDLRPTPNVESAIRKWGRVQLADGYRDYISRLGRTLAQGGAKDIIAAVADITVEHLDVRYDLVVVTNVFPYLSDPELLLAVANISRMLNQGGILIHNEPRPALADALLALRMPLLQSRSGVIATTDHGTPLYDAVWMHEVTEIR